MKTRRCPREDVRSIFFALAVPVGLLGCSSSSSAPSPDGDGGASADAESPTDGAPADGATHDDGGPDAAVDPTLNPDPQDLDPTNGDPALDIAASGLYFDQGAPWVRVVFYGAWPPPATLLSWGCSVLLGTQNAPVVTYTVQGASGTQTDSVIGMDKSKVTFAVEPKGFRVLLGDSTIAFDRYGLECDVQKDAKSTLVQDSSGSFVITTKVERPFGP
jgi:hypothetical protein